ncbi:MAG: hypothetical protein U0401_22015 [Anaerolineae bacterium]
MIAGLKSNRCLNGKKISQWQQELRHKRYEQVTVPAADVLRKFSLSTSKVDSVKGSLLTSPRLHFQTLPGKSSSLLPVYRLTLTAQAGLVNMATAITEMNNFYLKNAQASPTINCKPLKRLKSFTRSCSWPWPMCNTAWSRLWRFNIKLAHPPPTISPKLWLM